jgi:5-amino-6-(5-phospho-D-ribitylamino)uracil phosphatase
MSGQRLARSIRLIATDLDGTLLDSSGGVPPANRNVLERAVRAGVQLALVTARRASSTEAIASSLNLPCARIIHNGARMWDWTGVEVHHLCLPLPLARAIASFADEHQIGLIVTIDEINYYGAGARNLWRDVDDVVVATNLEALVGAPTRMIAAGTEGIDLICDRFGDALDSVVVHRYYSRVGAIESAVMTHPRATKRNALATLCERSAIDPAEVLTLGDAEADAEMLAWAGVGVAMANAMEEARSAASWIAPSHDESGVAAAIERFVFQPD